MTGSGVTSGNLGPLTVPDLQAVIVAAWNVLNVNKQQVQLHHRPGRADHPGAVQVGVVVARPAGGVEEHGTVTRHEGPAAGACEEMPKQTSIQMHTHMETFAFHLFVRCVILSQVRQMVLYKHIAVKELKTELQTSVQVTAT